jgi:hypothetical protein
MNIFNPPLNLFNTNVANASDSTSSQIINKGRFSFIENSKNGIIDYKLITFLSVIKISGFSNSTF